MAPYAFIGPEHALAPRIERFRAAIAARGLHPDGARVHADLTLRPDAAGGLALHRAYWSLQANGPDGFRATTLSYHATRDRATWLAYPQDPELPALGDLGGDVLRYMPLRRCTARTPEGIRKVKRPRRAGEAWELLGAVHRVLGDGRAGFAVPAPLAHDPAHAMFLQTALPGDDLSRRLDNDRLRHAGALHRAMHRTQVAGVPAEDPAQALAELGDDARWVAFALPEHADAVRAIRTALERHRLEPPPRPAFCHGDLVPSQMLVDGDRWSSTDFDGARIGDPHRDLALWLAALPYDVPALAQAVSEGDEATVARAEAAYLDGYGAHDERRLRWHRAAAELHSVAVALKKDRYEPPGAARSLRVARACVEDLRR